MAWVSHISTMDKRSIFIILFSLLTFQLSGQQLYKEGFVLTTALDTLHGEIRYVSYNQAALRCVFKAENGNETTYFPKDIFGYGIGDQLLFHSKSIPDANPLFLEVIYQGETTLYSYRDPNQRNFFYLENNDTKEFRSLDQKVTHQSGRKLVLKQYLLVLKMMLPQPELVADEIDNTPYSAKGISRLLIAHDERSARNKGFKYHVKRRTSPPKLALLMGGSAANLTLNGHNGNEQDRFLTFGLRIEKELSRNTGRLFLDADLMISNESYRGTFDASQMITSFNDIVSNFINITTRASFVGLIGDIEYNTQVHLDRTIVSLPLGLKYKVPGRKFNFTFGGGLEFQYAGSNEVLVDGQILQDNAAVVEELSIVLINRFRAGINAGLGVSYNGRHTIFLDLRHSPNWLDHGVLKYSYTRLILGVSLSKNK